MRIGYSKVKGIALLSSCEHQSERTEWCQRRTVVAFE